MTTLSASSELKAGYRDHSPRHLKFGSIADKKLSS